MGPRKWGLLANDFLHELIEGKFTSADRVLQKLKGEVEAEEWQKGYINALEGMLLALQSRTDKFAFIANIEAKEADKFLKTFARLSKDRMQSEFDHGFFSAWVDYVRVLKDLGKSKIDWYANDSASKSRSR